MVGWIAAMIWGFGCMKWGQLWSVLANDPLAFSPWMGANLGGLLVAYGAVLMILFFHKVVSPFLPGPEVS
jgi:hypothetical protein